MDGINENEAAQWLADHYRDLGNQERDFRNHNLLRLIASLVEGEDVLDIGCGAGTLIKHLAARGKQAFGLEPNRQLVKLAEQLHPEATIYNGMGDRVAHLGRRFDCITIIDVLEHIEDDIAQLYDLRQALVPGGQLIVLVPAYQALYGKRDVSNGHYRRYEQADLLEKMHCCGFEVQSTRYWNALGVLPYWFSERVLKRELQTKLRTEQAQGFISRVMWQVLNRWFDKFENRFNFGFGLSLIVTATRPANEAQEESPRKAAA